MKKITIIFLLAAGMFLSLVGCQEKAVNPDGKGARVVFSAVSGSPATRTAYSGEGTGNPGSLTWERIDWVANDQILIWSDKAQVSSGNEKYSTYWIQSVEANGNESLAGIDTQPGKDLRYSEEGGEHTFWGLYPADAVSTTPTGDNLSFSIPALQSAKAAVSDGNVTCTPDMTKAVMLAKLTGAKSGKAANIYFYPAYTAFELTFSVDPSFEGDAIYLHHVTLESSSDLVGTVAATIATGTRNFTVANTDAYAFITNNKEYTVGASTYTASSTGKTVTLNITDNNGQPQAAQLAKGKELKMTIVTLPQNVNDLTIYMYMGQDGSDVRKGTLKITPTGESAKKNLAFAACQKHNIRGVLLKPNDFYFYYITTDLHVLDWDEVAIEGESGDYPQAYQFSVSGEGVRNGGPDDLDIGGGVKDPYRQQWYFMPTYSVVEEEGQDPVTKTTTVTVFFKVALPAGGSWEIEPVGGTETNPVPDDLNFFTIKNVSPAFDDDTPTVATQLWGNMHDSGTTAIRLEITYKAPTEGTDTDQHSLYFHTYVYSGPNKTGNKFNIDSETQLYDRGRGYHTFFVNSSYYPND